MYKLSVIQYIYRQLIKRYNIRLCIIIICRVCIYMMNYVVDNNIVNELNKIIIDGLMNSWKLLDLYMNNIQKFD